MDNILSQIHDACKLASDLERSLQTIAVLNPHSLLGYCEDIVASFNQVIEGLHVQLAPQSPYSSSTSMFMEVSRANNEVASSSHDSIMQAMDHFGINQMFGSSSSTGNQGHEVNLSSELPKLALNIRPMPMEFGFQSCSRFGDDDRGEVPTAAVSRERSSSRRRSEGSSVQRSSRKRREGAVTRRVEALRTGNLEAPPDDGYTWRKYGQKDILNCRFPRSYYRCTHKSYYGCQAKKLVQRLDEDPYMFEVTYWGEHTCQTSTTPILIPTVTLPPTMPSVSSNEANNMMMMITNDGHTTIDATAAPSFRPAIESSSSVPAPLAAYFSTWMSLNMSSSDNQLLNMQAQTLMDHQQRGEGTSHGQHHVNINDHGSVVDLADVMFNSGSSGSSMDAIFSSKHDHEHEHEPGRE